ncbi:hypothetical protein G6F61_014764 [Rhizopus arrhizus]|nr:hypothetical protein G6F61_014764 [Rhizopus arrhizus]
MHCRTAPHLLQQGRRIWRWTVERSTPSCRAASDTLPPQRASVVRSAASSALSAAPAGAKVSGRSRGVMTPSSHKAAATAMTLASSRMLPGQACAFSANSAAGDSTGAPDSP